MSPSSPKMPDHQIRLRGPWHASATATSDLGERRVATVHMDRAAETLADFLPDGFVGQVRLERAFHRPSGLSERSRVRLSIAGNLSGTLGVNDHALGSIAPGANTFDLTPILEAHNRIQLDVLIDARGTTRQPKWDMRLEIFDGVAGDP